MCVYLFDVFSACLEHNQGAEVLTAHPNNPLYSRVVERSHSWLNRCHRIPVRWEKKSAHYVALLHFAGAAIALCADGVVG